MRLKDEKEILYFDGSTIIETVKVIQVNKATNTAKLSNKVIVQRQSSGDQFPRIDGKKGYGLAPTEENLRLYQAYKSYHEAKKALEGISNKLKDGPLSIDPDFIINLNQKLKEL